MYLRLHSDASGLRFYLDGEPVNCGDIIEVLHHGQWIKVQFGWSGTPDNLAFGIIDFEQTTITLKPETLVRWPRD